jgi:type III pantothenate kinase
MNTNTLLFDAGNSRFKWALVRNGRLGPQRAVPREDLSGFVEWLARAPSLTRVVGVNVAGPQFERALRAALRAGEAPRPEFIASTRVAAGVRNAYARPERLGADRWAAAIAAWHRAGCYRTVCAVGIGTALTLDLVDQDGYHRGGLIAPGPALMRDSLLGRTADIAARATLDAQGRERRPTGSRPLVRPLAGATRGAIEEGCLAAAAGFIDRTVNQITRALNVRPVVFITGGAAGPVIERIRSACRPCDDLVLRGVATIAEVPIRRRA